LIGAPEASSEGRAFARLAGTTSPSVYCTAKTNSIGCVPSISATGISSLTIGDSFHVVASNVLNQKSGFLFWGHVATATPFWDATMCVALPRWRTPPQFSNGTLVGVDCTGSYDLHFSNAYMATVPISAGDTLFAQYWSRDPFLAAPNSFGLTAGIQFLVVP
jgi:hypothetical protein